MKIGIRKKLLIGFGFVLLLFTIAVIFTLTSIQSLSRNVQMTHDHPLAVTRASIRIEVMVTAMHRSMKDVSLSYDAEERGRYKAAVENNEGEALRQFEIIQKQILGAEGQSLAVTAKKTFLKWRPIRERVISLADEGKFTQAQEITRTEGNDYVEFVMSEMEKLGEYAANKALGFNEESFEIAARTRIITLVAFILSCLFGIFIALYLSISITNRLSRISSAASKMADGDLKQAIEIKGKDELNEVAQKFNAMANQLSLSHEKLEQRIIERTEELNASHKKLQSLLAHLQTAREEERSSLARQIHDEIGQELAALQMDLFMIKRKLTEKQTTLEERVQKMQELLSGTIKKLRTLYDGLRPRLLDDFGILKAIEVYGQEFQKKSGIRFDWVTNVEEISLGKDEAIGLFRIFQEVLINVSRHAEATEVKVRCNKHKGVLELQLKDNGKGMPEEKLNDSESFGIIGIKERVEFLRGKVNIKGLHDKGTTVTVSIPL